MTDILSRFSATNDQINSGKVTESRPTEKTLLWCNIALVSLVDNNPQIIAYPARLPLDKVHEWKQSFGTSSQRAATEELWARLKKAASELEPGTTTVFGSKDGELKPGVNFILSRVANAPDTDEASNQLDAFFTL